MHRVVGLQNRINQLSTQFAAKTEKKTKRHPVLYAVAGFLIAFALITSTPLKAITYPITIPFFSAGGMELQVMVWNIVNLVLSAIIGAVLYGVISKSADKGRERKNATIDQSNAQVEANNQALAQSIEQTKQEIFAVQQRWAAEVAPWYPMDYDNIDAVDFFLTAVGTGVRTNSWTKLVRLGVRECRATPKSRRGRLSRRSRSAAGRSPARSAGWDTRAARRCTNG